LSNTSYLFLCIKVLVKKSTKLSTSQKNDIHAWEIVFLDFSEDDEKT
jgi:hypothetical protein